MIHNGWHPFERQTAISMHGRVGRGNKTSDLIYSDLFLGKVINVSRFPIRSCRLSGGLILFGQKLDFPAILGMGLIVAGVIIIHLFSETSGH